MLCLDEPHRIEIDDGDDGTEIAGTSGDALAHRSEPDHDYLTPVQRQSRDRRRLEGSGRPMAGSSSGRDQVAAHVAQGISRFADEPRQRLVKLAGTHPGTRPDLDADRCQVGDSAIVGAVGVARRQTHPSPGLDERSHDANRVHQFTSTAPVLQAPRRGVPLCLA